MVEWYQPPIKQVDDALDEAWISLDQIINDQPEFEQVTGIPIAKMIGHAREAADSYLDFDKTHPAHGLTEQLMQVYCLGFVVGTRYGEARTEQTHPINESP